MKWRGELALASHARQYSAWYFAARIGGSAAIASRWPRTRDNIPPATQAKSEKATPPHSVGRTSTNNVCSFGSVYMCPGLSSVKLMKPDINRSFRARLAFKRKGSIFVTCFL